MAGTTEESAGDTAIRPFTVEIPEAEIEALRARLAATRRPHKELAADASQGVQSKMLQELARCWETEYDWSKAEARASRGVPDTALDQIGVVGRSGRRLDPRPQRPRRKPGKR